MLGSKENFLSPSNSLEFDSYDLLEDEMLRGFASKQSTEGATKDPPHPMSRSRQELANIAEDLVGVRDSLEFDNSDDLNKIIQKYETMLGPAASNTRTSKSSLSGSSTKKEHLAALKSRLEESWGSHERLIEEISHAKLMNPIDGTPAAVVDEDYEEDDFEKTEDYDDKVYRKEAGFEDNEDEKIVDEEFSLSDKQKDSDFLKELMKAPIRTKMSQPPPKAAKTDDVGEYADEIDEFIKKHIENAEKEKLKEAMKQAANAKRFSSTNSSESSGDSHDETNEEDSEEEKGKNKSPKEHLIECLNKLSDSFSKYSLTDR